MHAAIVAEQEAKGVRYSATDRLEVRVLLYLKGNAVQFHDLDNRLKDILDALQGRAGGPKSVRSLEPVIPDDKQVYRVVIEKAVPPKQSLGLGHLWIRSYRKKK